MSNIKLVSFGTDTLLQHLVETRGKLKIWFCDLGLLRNHYYFLEYIVSHIKNEGCEKIDV